MSKTYDSPADCVYSVMEETLSRMTKNGWILVREIDGDKLMTKDGSFVRVYGYYNPPGSPTEIHVGDGKKGEYIRGIMEVGSDSLPVDPIYRERVTKGLT